MRSTPGEAPADRSAGVTALLDAVAVLAEADIAGGPVAGRLAEVRQLWPALCAAQAQLLRRVADLHKVGAAAGDGFVSTTAWVRGRLHLDGGRASLLVRTGAGLDRRAQTVAALVDGAISVEHAAAIVDAATDLGEQVLTDEVEKVLVDFARDHPPAELRRLIRQIKLALLDDDDAAERQVRLHQGRWLNASRTFEGMVHIEGMFDPVAGAQILAALAAFTPGPDPEGDAHRPATPRRRVHRHLHHRPGQQDPRRRRRRHPLHHPDRLLGNPLRHPHRAVPGQTPLATPSSPHPARPDGSEPAEAGQPDPPGRPTAPARTPPRRPAQRNRAPPPAQTSTTDAGSWPRWLGPPPALPATARRIASATCWPASATRYAPAGRRCSATPANRSAPKPPAGWPATPASSRSCSAPAANPSTSADSPGSCPRRCAGRSNCGIRHADSPAATGRRAGATATTSQHWAHGGATCLANLILLCRFHHSLVHEYGWRLHLDPHTFDVSATRPDGSAYDLISRHDRLESPRAGPSP